MKKQLAATLGAAIAFLLLASSTAEARPERMCPMIYRPVCAMTRAGHPQTFGNRCEAESADAVVLHDGRCRHRHR